MKKIIAFLLCVAVICSLAGCAKKETPVAEQPKETPVAEQPKETVVTEEKSTKADMYTVLNRKIFMFKNDKLNIYKENIDNIENTKSYKQDWAFEKILNNINYANVSWETATLDSGAQIITFSGMTKRKLKDVTVEFYIAADSEVPMARSITIGSGENAEKISIDDFENMRKDADVAADIAISCKLLEFASGAM